LKEKSLFDVCNIVLPYSKELFTFSVQEDDTILLIIEGWFLDVIWQYNRTSCARFYHFYSTIIAKYLDMK